MCASCWSFRVKSCPSLATGLELEEGATFLSGQGVGVCLVLLRLDIEAGFREGFSESSYAVVVWPHVSCLQLPEAQVHQRYWTANSPLSETGLLHILFLHFRNFRGEGCRTGGSIWLRSGENAILGLEM